MSYEEKPERGEEWEDEMDPALGPERFYYHAMESINGFCGDHWPCEDGTGSARTSRLAEVDERALTFAAVAAGMASWDALVDYRPGVPHSTGLCQYSLEVLFGLVGAVNRILNPYWNMIEEEMQERIEASLASRQVLVEEAMEVGEFDMTTIGLSCEWEPAWSVLPLLGMFYVTLRYGVGLGPDQIQSELCHELRHAKRDAADESGPVRDSIVDLAAYRAGKAHLN